MELLMPLASLIKQRKVNHRQYNLEEKYDDENPLRFV